MFQQSPLWWSERCCLVLSSSSDDLDGAVGLHVFSHAKINTIPASTNISRQIPRNAISLITSYSLTSLSDLSPYVSSETFTSSLRRVLWPVWPTWASHGAFSYPALHSRSESKADQPDDRQELLAWLNNLLQLNMTKIEQCGTGYAPNPITSHTFTQREGGCLSKIMS